jgi:hypothetical protein
VRYDFYLKVEDMAVWFADLVSLLGLEDAVATGWGADYKKVVKLPILQTHCAVCLGHTFLRLS